MAGNIDPSKNTVDSAAIEGLNKNLNGSNAGAPENQLINSNVVPRQPSSNPNQQMNVSGDQQYQDTSNANDLYPSQMSEYPENSRKQTSLLSIFTKSGSRKFPWLARDSQVNIVEQQTDPYWENGEDSFEEWNQQQQTSYHNLDQEYPTTPPPTYNEDGYYNYEQPYKKKNFSTKVDNFVLRFPFLGKFYKQPPSSPDNSVFNPHLKYDGMASAYIPHQVERSLTADELTLHDRYSDKSRARFIKLADTEQTQPVDLNIFQDTNKIYSCDVGRSVIEIFDIDGTLKHVVDDKVTSKFKPTAIGVTFDETIIVASHFTHCLHMYSPNEPNQSANCYSYKQFKLGTPGDQVHQFYCPAGITIDKSDGFVYVCDRGNYRIQVIKPEGICDRVIHLRLNDKSKCQLDPVRVAIQHRSNYIVCIIGGNALCFIPKTASGKVYVDPLYIVDENGLSLENASGIAVDNHDRIYISDTSHNRIVICTPEGGYITSFGTQGDGLCEFKRPCGLDVTNDGTIVIADPGNKRIQLLGSISSSTTPENTQPQEAPAVPTAAAAVVENNILIDTESDLTAIL